MYNSQLDTFIQVADEGSFSKAAQNMFISPTAVIKQINRLEADLGFNLFDRNHQGVVLTESGRSLYKDARYMIKYAKASIDRAKKAGPKYENIIRIGTSIMTPSKFLIELWPKIEKECPTHKFQLVSFENTPENAREILANLGQNIDLVAGVFDENFSKRGCAMLELYKSPICCAVSKHHPLAQKDKLTISDLYGETLMLIRKGWNSYVDVLRDELWQNHPSIGIETFDFYDVNIFNKCENTNNILMAVQSWDQIHPMLKIIPVDWPYKIPFGIMYSPMPEKHVYAWIKAVEKVFHQE